MTIEVTVNVDYNGHGCKKISLTDMRDTYKEVIAKANDDGVPVDFIKRIVSMCPRLSSIGLEQIRAKYDHYFEGTDVDGAAQIDLWMKEIASMDEDLSRRIIRRSTAICSSLGTLLNATTVVNGLDRNKKPVVKLVYKTDMRPDGDDNYNEYDEEHGIRTTWCDPMPSVNHARHYSLWLAGALNVRQVDEADQL